MESSWNIKVEAGDVATQVDTGNEESSEVSSLACLIPEVKLEIGDSESTATGPVNFIQEEGGLVGELESRCLEQDKELKFCETVTIKNEQLKQSQELSLQRQVDELTGERREDSVFEKKVFSELVSTEREGSLESYPIIANVDSLDLEHGNEVDFQDLDVPVEQIPVVDKPSASMKPPKIFQGKFRRRITRGQQRFQSESDYIKIKIDDEDEKISKEDLHHYPDPSMENTCVCGYQGRDNSLFRTHIKNFTEEKVFKCGRCPDSFRLVSSLRSHTLQVHPHASNEEVNGMNAGCRLCGQTFSEFEALVKHAEREHGIEAKSAKWLRESVKRRRGRKKMPSKKSRSKINDIDDKIFTCSVCSSTGSSGVYDFSELNYHMRSHHGITSSVRCCNECGIGFSSRDEQSRHREIVHDAVVKSRSEEMQQDMGTAPLSPVKRPPKKSRRERMKKMDDGRDEGIQKSSPIIANVDSLDFNSRNEVQFQDLDVNMQQTPVVDKNYQQPSTSKLPTKGKVGRPRKRPLRVQVYKPMGKRALEADLPHSPDPSKENACVCGHQAKTHVSLGNHIKYYTAEKVLKCGHCPDSFQNVSQLRSHILRYHKHVPIQEVNRIKAGCRHCGQTFSDFKVFGEHTETEHGIEAKSLIRSIRRRRKHNVSSSKLRKSRRAIGESFTCALCGSSFLPVLTELNTHMSLHHGITSKLICACIECGIGFSTRREHAQHREIVHGSVNKFGLKMMQLDFGNANLSLRIEGPPNESHLKSDYEGMEGIDSAGKEVDEATPIKIEDEDESGGQGGQLLSSHEAILGL